MTLREQALELLAKFNEPTNDDDETIKERIEHVICGLNSGYPPCCIMYYVNNMWPLHELDYDRNYYYSEEKKDFVEDVEDVDVFTVYTNLMCSDKEHTNYFRCPACVLAGNVATMQRCARYKDSRIGCADCRPEIKP